MRWKWGPGLLPLKRIRFSLLCCFPILQVHFWSYSFLSTWSHSSHHSAMLQPLSTTPLVTDPLRNEKEIKENSIFLRNQPLIWNFSNINKISGSHSLSPLDLVQMLHGCSRSTAESLALFLASTSNPASYWYVNTLGGSCWWLKCLAICHPCGKSHNCHGEQLTSEIMNKDLYQQSLAF